VKRIYVCHRYSDDPEGNTRAIKEICRDLTARGYCPIAPQLYLPHFLDEFTERETAMTLCLDLIRVCDEVWVYQTARRPEFSLGQIREIDFAAVLEIPFSYTTDHGGQS
jgi:SRSO17 transposase